MSELFDVMDRAVAGAGRIAAQAGQPVVRDVPGLVKGAATTADLVQRAAGLVAAQVLDQPGARRLRRHAGVIGLAGQALLRQELPSLRDAGAVLSQSGNNFMRAMGQVLSRGSAVQSLGGRLFGGQPLDAVPAAGFLLELASGDPALPPFRFALGKAAFDSLSRATQFGISTQDRLTRRPAAQAVGKGSDKITLKGAIYLAAHGAGHIDRLRELGDALLPLTVTTGYGQHLGRWYLASLNEDQEFLFVDGAPRKQTFTLELTRYGDDYQNV